MNQLTNFQFDGNQVRTIVKEDQIWWVASDVCNVLDIQNTTQAVQKLDEDERSMFNIGRQGVVNVVNEYGLYTLIMSSRKAEAKEFKRWVTHEILPTIRKTGSYELDKPKTQAELMLMYAESFVQMENRVEQMETTVTTIQETFMQRDEDWRKMINGMMTATSFRRGGDYQELRKESYSRLEERGRCDLNTRLRNLRNRLEKAGHTKTRINGISRMDVIEDDPRLKEIYTTIVKEISIGSLKLAVSR